MKRFVFISFIALVANSATTSASNLASNFDVNKEGWRVAGDGNPIVWKKQGGNPGGYIEITDKGDGRVWYFVSPTNWAGNWSKFKKLSFDLKQVGNGDGFADRDLIIVGNNGKSISWKGERDPSVYWTPYTIPLDPATFKTTLSNFTAIITDVNRVMIRGEYITGTDTGGLDNVELSESPAEIEGTISGFGIYTVTCKNITTQKYVTLPGNVKLDWNCENSGLIVNDGDSVSITIKGNATK